MKLNQKNKLWIIAGAAVILLTAWTGNPGQDTGRYHINKDTVPQKKSITREPGDKDLDYELRKLMQAQEQLKAAENKDWEKIQQQVETAIKNIDLEKINLQVQEAMQKVDMEKISRDVEQSLRSIDFDKIQQEIELSMQNMANVNMEEVRVELDKARLEVKEQLANKNWQKEIREAQEISKEDIREEMEKARKEMERVKTDLDLERINFSGKMTEARKEIEKAREEMKGYQEMIYAMEKDGLLNTKSDYTIEYRKDVLFINGQQQPENVTGKYKKYFTKDRVTIKKEKGNINISHNGNSNIHID